MSCANTASSEEEGPLEEEQAEDTTSQESAPPLPTVILSVPTTPDYAVTGLSPQEIATLYEEQHCVNETRGDATNMSRIFSPDHLQKHGLEPNELKKACLRQGLHINSSLYFVTKLIHPQDH